jgi:uncharacterized coiled-coil protein SlyX
MAHPPQSQDERLERLEEATGFSDRQIEVLSGEIAEINKAVLGLTRRLAHIEARLSELNDRVGEDAGQVPPPHSAGPDFPKERL